MPVTVQPGGKSAGRPDPGQRPCRPTQTVPLWPPRLIRAWALRPLPIKPVSCSSVDVRSSVAVAATTAALAEGRLDAITFSSGKTVQHTAQLLEQQFGDSWREPLEQVRLISIGPQTSKTLQAVLGRVDGEANPHDLDGLVAACSAALKD